MKPGKFIVIEGLEGAGKSSAIDLIRNAVASAGHQVITTREPGGTPMAEAIRELVKRQWQERVSSATELLLMYASRSQLVENVIRPALNAGTWVIGDRHDLSSQAYQGGGRGVDARDLGALKALTMGDFTPDLTLYMDVEPATGLARARGRGELDRIEHEAIDFFERTRARYLELAQGDPRIEVVDSMQDMAAVQQDIQSVILRFLEDTHASLA